jgi:hypothetical protein
MTQSRHLSGTISRSRITEETKTLPFSTSAKSLMAVL